MGAVVYETGGILIDDGWLQILGSGSAKLPRGLGSWNLGRTQSEPAAPAPYYLIADDAAGGYFAINGGRMGGVATLLQELDSKVHGLPMRTTAENISAHIFHVLQDQGLPVSLIRLWETPTSYCEYSG